MVTLRLEPMRIGDIPAVIEIERHSFSITWPARAYRRELEENRLAHYIVVRQLPATEQAPNPVEPKSALQGLMAGVRHLVGKNGTQEDSPMEGGIVGYVGLWIMVDEAHITTIAVHPDWRRHGVGELLLIAAAELARELHAAVLTLEVRASNTAAQALYQKFGFAMVGVRRRYYSDNNEDALIMTTDAIEGQAFQDRLRHIKTANAEKLGPVEWCLSPAHHSAQGR